jgi:hypothetical protein
MRPAEWLVLRPASRLAALRALSLVARLAEASARRLAPKALISAL